MFLVEEVVVFIVFVCAVVRCVIWFVLRLVFFASAMVLFGGRAFIFSCCHVPVVFCFYVVLLFWVWLRFCDIV